MTDKPIDPRKDIWLPLVFLLLGIFLQIIIARAFKDSFYIALILTVIILIVAFFALMPSKVMKWVASAVTLIVAIGLIVYYRTSDRPNFEINFIGLPLAGDNSYYVTDTFIRTEGDLSRYQGFEISPLSVEVIPHYLGDEKFGNVILRVSGKGSVKDIPLWPDFDKSAQTQTVKLSLADIVKISGIRITTDDLDTSLKVGEKPYQEEALKFEVIRLSAPDRPFDPVKELPVKNTPWKQQVALTYRDGLTLDYALTNFGADTTFGCDITVARTLADVSVDSHAFWSGVESLDSAPDCGRFTVKRGETYTASFPLNEETLRQDLTHGRYLVQLYSFADRKDFVFNDGSSFESYRSRWIYGNDADIATFVICNDPGKSCEETDTLPVEGQTISTFAFSSKAERDNGTTSFAVRTYPDGNRSANQYLLDYWIDPQRDGWAGIGIWFENSLDVSEFDQLRFKLKLDKSAHPLWLDVKYKVGQDYKTSRVPIGDGNYGDATPEEQTVIVPFSAFEEVDWTQVDSLNIGLDSSSVPDTEKHEIQVGEIEFIR